MSTLHGIGLKIGVLGLVVKGQLQKKNAQNRLAMSHFIL